MNASLESWVEQATRGLALDSAARVRTEIEEHYRSGILAGAPPSDVLAALGDPKSANREYRRVLLTAAETKHLRRMAGEARFVCARRVVRSILIAIPILLMSFAAVYYPYSPRIAQGALLVGIVLGPWLTGPVLPIYSRRRSRIFRVVKWSVLIAACTVFGGSHSYLLLPSLLGTSVYFEFLNYSIRRKLPVERWPKALYL